MEDTLTENGGDNKTQLFFLSSSSNRYISCGWVVAYYLGNKKEKPNAKKRTCRRILMRVSFVRMYDNTRKKNKEKTISRWRI